MPKKKTYEPDFGKACLLRSGHRHITLQLLLICFVMFYPVTSSAQLSYGGKPLDYGIEYSSGLRTAVDYFVEMPSFNVDSVRAIDDLPGNRIGGLKFAHTFFTDLSPENSGITFYTEDGTKVWKVGVRSPGAYSLNVLFSEFQIPDSAKVYIYNSDRSTILGSFTNRNNTEGGEFSIAPVDGEELTVEYHEPADATFSGRIRITEVNHDYRGLFRSGTRFNIINLPCLPDISCENSYDTIASSVCLLIINGSIYCTGTLVNNTARNGKPYLLTASHCLQNNASYGDRVVVFMNYQSPHCDRRIRGSEEFSLSGSVTKALSNEIDFALLELNEMPPADYRPYLAGWTTDTIATGFAPFTCIHHPFGEVKKYCVEEDPIVKIDWNGGDGIAKGNHWNVYRWEIGHTWTGSSGSPLFDKNNHIRGGLSGGDSGGTGGCGSYTTGDFFFRFDKAWNLYSDSTKQLKHWLDPLTPDTIRKVTTIDGMNPYSENPATRISNILPEDSLCAMYLDFPDKGPMFGQNTLGVNQYAEHFVTNDSSMLKGVYLVAAKGSRSTSAPVKVKVYRGGKIPGAVIGSAVLNPNYIDYLKNSFTTVSKNDFSNRENYLRFSEPISVGTDFYVGYEVSYAIESQKDSFYVYSAMRDNQFDNTAFFKSNFVWFPVTSHFTKPMRTSLWIEPVVMRDTISNPDTIINNDTDTLIIEKPLFAYSDHESTLYIWLPADWTGDTKMQIFDLSGRLVKQTLIKAQISSIPFIPRDRGLYFFRLTCRQKNYTTKFMKYP